MLTRSYRAFLLVVLLLTQGLLTNVAFAQWTRSSGVGNTYIGCITSSGNDLIAGCGLGKKDSILTSSDHGNTWMVLSSNVPTIVTSMVNIGTNLIVGSNLPGGSYYSTNFGSTWSPNTLDFPFPPITDYSISALAVIDDTIFAGTGTGVYLQIAPGTAWIPDTVGMGNSTGEYPTVISFLMSGSNFFAATQITGAFLSTNDGGSWTQINGALPSNAFSGITVYKFAALGSTIFAAIVDTDQIHTNIYSTTDRGQSWSKANMQPQNWSTIYGFLSGGENLFIAADSSIYVSSDHGANWVAFDQGFPMPGGNGDRIISMDTSGSNLVVGTVGNGIWTRKLSDFPNSSVNPSSVPNNGLNITVSENPAYGSEVKITYTLRDGGVAQVKLMDELGREVRMLQNGHAPAGENTVTIDPLTEGPGTYFVRVEANDQTAMQKLVISR
jgi:photosystem II stability/assembly factor-like uncharacterized protein